MHVDDLTLNPAVFANAEELQEPENLGRLKTTMATGDGQHETIFNCSDDKGPEPEGLTIGQIGGRTYAFIGFERGGIAVYDVTDAYHPEFVQYVNNRSIRRRGFPIS